MPERRKDRLVPYQHDELIDHLLRSPLERLMADAREVRDGFECGIGLSDFQDLKQGDLIETYEEREIART